MEDRIKPIWLELEWTDKNRLEAIGETMMAVVPEMENGFSDGMSLEDVWTVWCLSLYDTKEEAERAWFEAGDIIYGKTLVEE